MSLWQTSKIYEKSGSKRTWEPKNVLLEEGIASNWSRGTRSLKVISVKGKVCEEFVAAKDGTTVLNFEYQYIVPC